MTMMMMMKKKMISRRVRRMLFLFRSPAHFSAILLWSPRQEPRPGNGLKEQTLAGRLASTL